MKSDLSSCYSKATTYQSYIFSFIVGSITLTRACSYLMWSLNTTLLVQHVLCSHNASCFNCIGTPNFWYFWRISMLGLHLGKWLLQPVGIICATLWCARYAFTSTLGSVGHLRSQRRWRKLPSTSDEDDIILLVRIWRMLPVFRFVNMTAI